MQLRPTRSFHGPRQSAATFPRLLLWDSGTCNGHEIPSKGAQRGVGAQKVVKVKAASLQGFVEQQFLRLRKEDKHVAIRTEHHSRWQIRLVLCALAEIALDARTIAPHRVQVGRFEVVVGQDCDARMTSQTPAGKRDSKISGADRP